MNLIELVIKEEVAMLNGLELEIATDTRANERVDRSGRRPEKLRLQVDVELARDRSMEELSRAL